MTPMRMASDDYAHERLSPLREQPPYFTGSGTMPRSSRTHRSILPSGTKECKQPTAVTASPPGMTSLAHPVIYYAVTWLL